jgi:uncharacterized membrane protein YdjX (TVP38/TMEM64 family)
MTGNSGRRSGFSRADPAQDPMTDPTPSPAARPPSPWRFLPLLLIAAGLAAAWGFGLADYLSCAALRDHRAWLLAAVEENYLLALVAFFLAYVLTVALSLPGGAALTVAGGFLFGTAVATATVVLAATLGAMALFEAARTAFAPTLRARAGPWLGKLQAGFAADGFSYLLFLRLVPLFPFFVVNLVPAFLGVSLRTYALATLIGIVPGTFVFASVGAGLGSIFDDGGTCTVEGTLTTEVIVALVGLALLALLPVALQKWRRWRRARAGEREGGP